MKNGYELKKIRDICNISIEAKRSSKEIGSSLEANLIISMNEEMIEVTKGLDFSEICITSGSTIKKVDSNEITVVTNKALGDKCPVCWKINEKKCTRHSN